MNPRYPELVSYKFRIFNTWPRWPGCHITFNFFFCTIFENWREKKTFKNCKEKNLERKKIGEKIFFREKKNWRKKSSKIGEEKIGEKMPKNWREKKIRAKKFFYTKPTLTPHVMKNRPESGVRCLSEVSQSSNPLQKIFHIKKWRK